MEQVERLSSFSSSSHSDSIEILEKQIDALDIKYSPLSTPRRPNLNDEPKWLIDLKRHHEESIRRVDAKIRRFEKLLDKAKKEKNDLEQHFTDRINGFHCLHQSKKYPTSWKRRAVKRLSYEKRR